MSNYISSNANRFYVALESAYGQAAPVTAANRFPAARLAAKQLMQQLRRRDKTGSRTFLGTSKSARRFTAFETHTYLTSWNGIGAPAYGPLFQSALGANPLTTGGATILATQGPARIQTATAHGLSTGSAVSLNGEIRFIVGVPDSTSMLLNAGFTVIPVAGSVFSPAVTFKLSTAIPSVTLYDCWDPSSAVQRIITGAAVDSFDLAVNGDYHEFTFTGPAADLLDSTSFVPGSAGLGTFPNEPALAGFDYSLVPGHLGQAWIGSPGNQFLTLTEAKIQVKNGIEVRNREFGATLPRAIAPGMREVVAHFSLLAQDDAQTAALYQAARSRTPLSTMLQLGQQQGQVMGIFMPQVMPEVPHLNDGDSRLEWTFQNCTAQGVADDEIVIAFA